VCQTYYFDRRYDMYQGLARCIGSFVVFSTVSAFAMSVSVPALFSASDPVGTVVTWNAYLDEAPEGTIWYRYRVRAAGEPQFRILRDFSPRNWFFGIPGLAEGTYEIEITARSRDTGETTSQVSTYEVTSRITGGDPVITPTSNELVFLYSAPPCPTGSRLTVNFVSANGFQQSVPASDCIDGKSLNVYLAGLRAETSYTVQQAVTASDGTSVPGPALVLETGSLSFTPAATHALQKPGSPGDQSVLLQNRLTEFSVATDTDGQVIWYLPEILPFITRFQPGGYFFVLVESPDDDDSGQLLREVDLAGNTVLETNAASINEQLAFLGKHPITSFHHEARRLADGSILVLAASERLLTDVQGAGEVDVLGDMILVLNSDLAVTWVWDAFDHLDVTRQAVLDEKCTPGGGGCPIFRLADTANDWLHGNSLSIAPDGNIIYSARHQDWIMKIDYACGNGSGNVLWRLGNGGDFRIVSNDPNPWFSHQHDASFEPAGAATRLMLFDNGNSRLEADANANSRGQVLDIDEASRTATLVVNSDLGAYSRALGSAQKLLNGNYFFNLGFGPNSFSQAIETDSSGNPVSRSEAETPQYRSFRMRDLYTP
jgi:arylsulfate sulfotransferase